MRQENLPDAAAPLDERRLHEAGRDSEFRTVSACHCASRGGYGPRPASQHRCHTSLDAERAAAPLAAQRLVCLGTLRARQEVRTAANAHAAAQRFVAAASCSRAQGFKSSTVAAYHYAPLATSLLAQQASAAVAQAQALSAQRRRSLRRTLLLSGLWGLVGRGAQQRLLAHLRSGS